MMMKAKFSFLSCPETLIMLLFSSLTIVAFPQETSSCAENLRNAQTLFDNGQVEQVPGMLQECLRSGFKQEEELAAYKLIIQTFLFQDMNEKADSAMLAFLKKYPEYQLSPTDHSSFVHQYNNFNVEPVIQLVLRLGANLPFVTFVDPRTLAVELGDWQYSSGLTNLFGSLEIKYALREKIELNLEGAYSQLSFTNTENFMGIGTVSYSEVQHRAEVPLTITWNFISFGKFTAYARGGAGPAFNIATTAKNVSFVPGNVIYFPDRESPDIQRNDCRIRMDLFGQAGGGVKLKIPKGYFNMELRANIGVYNQVKSRTGSAEQLDGYNYVDDDFNLNTLNISFGYTKIFYKPSKR